MDMTPQQEKFFKLARNRWKMGFFMLTKLPAAFFSGVRVKKIEPDCCEISVPYFYFSKNPFRSTYFACLAMAAEMSSGLLAMMHVYQSKPAVSMLVIQLSGAFHKKATGKTVFKCNDGQQIAAAIEQTKQTGEAVTFETVSEGFNEKNEKVATFKVLWTFKAKSSI